MSSDRRVRNRISPIQMNSGSEVRVQLDELVQTVIAMELPGLREVKPIMPI